MFWGGSGGVKGGLWGSWGRGQRCPGGVKGAFWGGHRGQGRGQGVLGGVKGVGGPHPGVPPPRPDCGSCLPGPGPMAALVVADIIMTLLIAGGAYCLGGRGQRGKGRSQRGTGGREDKGGGVSTGLEAGPERTGRCQQARGRSLRGGGWAERFVGGVARSLTPPPPFLPSRCEAPPPRDGVDLSGGC